MSETFLAVSMGECNVNILKCGKYICKNME
jgi:hypothetical protein